MQPLIMQGDYGMEELTEEFDPEYEAALKKYFLQCLLMEGSKIIIFFVIFGCLGLVKEYIASLMALMALRCYSGGIHCKRYSSCLMVSLLVLAGNVYMGTHFMIPRPYSIFILLACAAIGYWLSPIVSENRPEPEESLVRKSKVHTVCVVMLFILMICICPPNAYLTIVIWTTVIHIFQLLLAKFIKRRRRICQNF